MGLLDLGAQALLDYARSKDHPKPRRQFLTVQAFGKYYGVFNQPAPGVAAPAPPEPEGSQYMGNGFIPPGGIAGFSQMTPASRIALTGTSGRASRRKRRKKAKQALRRARSGVKRAPRAARKLVKGSAAAKRFMARLRAKRK